MPARLLMLPPPLLMLLMLFFATYIRQLAIADVSMMPLLMTRCRRFTASYLIITALLLDAAFSRYAGFAPVRYFMLRHAI